MQADKDTKIEAILANGAPDVVVLELEWSGRSGLEWLEEIRSRHIAPVVILAGGGDERLAVDAMKKGAADYIPKSFLTAEHFIHALVHARQTWNLMKEKEHLQEELARMAIYDYLTEVLTRRALMELLEAEIQRTTRYERDLSVMIVDIDHFKRVNDSYGHIVGDAVLRKVAQVLRKAVRRSDTVGRYGGEEFVIILPETPLEKALMLAEKLRKQIAAAAVKHEGQKLNAVTVSIGVAQYDEDSSVDHLINRSDQWLYKAKENGRNQVQPPLGTS